MSTGLTTKRVPFTKKISRLGRVRVPGDVVQALEIKEGDLVEFEIVRVISPPADAQVPAALAPVHGGPF